MARGHIKIQVPAHPITAKPEDDEGDYGSDWDEEDLAILNAQLEYILPKEDIETKEDNPIVNDVEYLPAPAVARMSASQSSQSSQRRAEPMRIEFDDEDDNTKDTERLGRIGDRDDRTKITYPDLSAKVLQLESGGVEAAETEVSANDINNKDNASDKRTPIQRYRAAPSRALSVTDLVSPAWCELQYNFHLSRHGKKKATPAMKKGTKVHDKLEEEVYTIVPMTTTSKEEAWGLRLWNVISGLKILAETGMTRELEVWSVLGGEVVGGVIDEVSLTSPNPGLEAGLKKVQSQGGKVKKEAKLEEGQTSLNPFLLIHGANTISGALNAVAQQLPSSQHSQSLTPKTPILYITDVKTRTARSLPNEVSFRPTKYQLQLYHRMLSTLSRGELDFSVIADHYGLDMQAPFGDAFIAQIVGLDADLDLILEHNSLAGLWSLLPSALASLSGGGKLPEVSPILTAEYRDPLNGSIKGSKSFVYDDADVAKYLNSELEWWKGEREAVGVQLQEAWKCGSCEFAPECEWRISKVNEAASRFRRRGRRESGGQAPQEAVSPM